MDIYTCHNLLQFCNLYSLKNQIISLGVIGGHNLSHLEPRKDNILEVVVASRPNLRVLLHKLSLECKMHFPRN